MPKNSYICSCMKKNLLFIILLFTAGALQSQNMIPNGDFEQFNACPYLNGEFNKVDAWINPSTVGTPDYFNSCGQGSSFVSTPENLLGFQYPHSGAAYVGIYLWSAIIPSFREYIEIQLPNTLTANACYHFQMYMSLGESNQFTTADVGVYFSDTLVENLPDANPLSFTPQINNPVSNFPDTASWTLVQGTYTAVGNEDYILIGNFKNDFQTSPVQFNALADIAGTHIYIDDVSLTPILCLGVNELDKNDGINIYPNPAEDFLVISSESGDKENVEITIRNLQGSICLRTPNSQLPAKIDISQFSNGIYFIEANTGKEILRKKIVRSR
jgi:hypothetical protein